MRQLMTVLRGGTPASSTLKGISKWYTHHMEWEPYNDLPPWGEMLWEIDDNSIVEVEPTAENMGGLFYQYPIGRLIARSDPWSSHDATFVEFLGHHRTIDNTGDNVGQLKISSRNEMFLINGRKWEADPEVMGLYANVPMISGGHPYQPGQEYDYGNLGTEPPKFSAEDYPNQFTYMKIENIEDAYNGRDKWSFSHDASFYTREAIYFKKDVVVCYDNLQLNETAATTPHREAKFRWFFYGAPSVNGMVVSLSKSNGNFFASVFGQNGTWSTPANSDSLPGSGGNDVAFFTDFDIAGTPQNNQLITVFECADNSQTIPTPATYITATDKKMKGVHIGGTRNFVAMFTTSKTGATPSGTITYSYPAGGTTLHVLCGMSGSYGITATGSKTKTITVNPVGSIYTSSDKGVISFHVEMSNSIN
jgi:hypothetical protein